MRCRAAKWTHHPVCLTWYQTPLKMKRLHLSFETSHPVMQSKHWCCFETLTRMSKPMTRSSTQYVASFGSNLSCRGNCVGHLHRPCIPQQEICAKCKVRLNVFTDFTFMLTAINPRSPPTISPRLLRGEDYAPHLCVSVDEDIVATEEDIVGWAFPIDISERTV